MQDIRYATIDLIPDSDAIMVYSFRMQCTPGTRYMKIKTNKQSASFQCTDRSRKSLSCFCDFIMALTDEELGKWTKDVLVG